MGVKGHVGGVLALGLAGLLVACGGGGGGVPPRGALTELSGTISNAPALGATQLKMTVYASSATVATASIDSKGAFKVSLPSDSQVSPYLTLSVICGQELMYTEGYFQSTTAAKTYTLRLSNFVDSEPRKAGDQRMVLVYFDRPVKLECSSGTATYKVDAPKGWLALLVTYTGSTTLTISDDPIPLNLVWKLE